MKQIEQIAERLRGLRDAIDITVDDMAESCGIDISTYQAYESGTTDIPVSFLHKVSQVHGVELTTLMFGDEPKMSSYFITRKGKGEVVERTKAYKYQSLAAGFSGRRADPFIVTVHPTAPDAPITLNTHAGQEFNMVVRGRMTLRLNGKDLTLEEGDSIFFNAELPHGMKALDDDKVSFLAIIF